MPPLYSYSYGETLLKLENVCLQYDGRPILNNLNAEIKKINRPGQVQGQIVGLLGPSGRGKSQTFYLIGGLNKPTSGMVSVNGFKRPVRAGEVGVVQQSYPLFSHLTIFSNLMCGARKKEKDDKTAQAKVMEFLNLFQLADKKNLYPVQLSGGQRQRCAIIQQILSSNHFLLMDEPFSGLDIIMEDKTLQLILQIANMDGLNTIVVVTHDVSAAASICDHLWLLGHAPDDPHGSRGSSIVKTYDLIERGLCWEQWQGMAVTHPALAEFIREVKQEFYSL